MDFVTIDSEGISDDIGFPLPKGTCSAFPREERGTAKDTRGEEKRQIEAKLMDLDYMLAICL